MVRVMISLEDLRYQVRKTSVLLEVAWAMLMRLFDGTFELFKSSCEASCRDNDRIFNNICGSKSTA